MKVFINRKPVDGPWGGGNLFVKAFYEHSKEIGYEIIENPISEKPDLIFLQSPNSSSNCNFSIKDAITIKRYFPNIEIVLRVNECDARKGTSGVDDFWIECSKHVDKTIFVSNWMMDYFIAKGWKCSKNYVLYNGVNLEHFKPREKIENGKVNIVTHHWSNNRLKGFDIYESIDRFVGENKNFTFTYIGRHLGTFKNTNTIDPLFGIELGKELSKYDVYISDSKFDPGPNHILESLACNIPTFVCKDGGGSVELAGNNNVFNNFKDLKKALVSKNFKNNNFKNLYDWKDCILNLGNILKYKRG